MLTRGVAIHREVEHAGAGLIADDDASSLAAALLRMRNATLRTEMSKNAKQLARDTFSIHAMQQGLMQMYERVLAS